MRDTRRKWLNVIAWGVAALAIGTFWTCLVIAILYWRGWFG